MHEMRHGIGEKRSGEETSGVVIPGHCGSSFGWVIGFIRKVILPEKSDFAERRKAGNGGGCKWVWRALVWARRAKIDECDGARRKNRSRIGNGAVSGGAGHGDFLQGMAAGSGAADVDEQS